MNDLKVNDFTHVLWEAYRIAHNYKKQFSEKKRYLSEYLHQLYITDVKVICTVMYIGRDYIYEQWDEYLSKVDENNGNEEGIPLPLYPVSNPDHVLTTWLHDLEQTFHDDKNQWIEIILGKIVKVDKYLYNGFSLLGFGDNIYTN